VKAGRDPSQRTSFRWPRMPLLADARRASWFLRRCVSGSAALTRRASAGDIRDAARPLLRVGLPGVRGRPDSGAGPASIALSLGSTAGTVGLAMTTYALAYGTGQLVYGPLSDRLGRIAVVRAAGLGFSLCTCWQPSLRRRAVHLRPFAGRGVRRRGDPLTLVFIGDTVAYARRQVVIGRFSMVTSAALAFSASVGGTVAYLVSWRVMLVGYGLLALVPVGLMWRLEARRPAGGAEGGGASLTFSATAALSSCTAASSWKGSCSGAG